MSVNDSWIERLLDATDEEWDDYIGCPHTGKAYTEVSRLTGVEHLRCRDCHSVVGEGKP